MGSNYSTTQPALGTPFDNTTNGFASDNVQGAIEEIGASASPGFSFGRSGNSNAGTYLNVDSVPSNQAGRIVPLTSGFITDVFLTCQTNATCSLQIQRRVGNTFTTIYTISLSNERKKTESVSGVAVSLGDELCVRVSSGSISNVVFGLIIRGGT